MRARWIAVPLFLLCGWGLPAQNPPEPAVKPFEPPKYPALAKKVRIQGVVRLEFSITPAGETTQTRVLSGHPLLIPTAVDNVRTWRFTPPESGFQQGAIYQTMFEFTFADSTERTGLLTSFRLVTVTAPLTITGIQAEGCPEEEHVPAPRLTQDDDFIELSRSECYGTCPAYMVKVFRNGRVEWEGSGYVKIRGNRAAQISTEKANQLIEQFRTERFWSLCELYSQSITDVAAADLTAGIGGQHKTVRDYASSAPAWVRDLQRVVDEIANTHQWRHGDPATERFRNILSDCWLPKPGVTPLMQAAGRGDGDRVEKLIREGADVNATDSSGWTALMYAATKSKDKPVEALVRAGASPNYASPQGDTALMARAFSGFFDGDLTKAGAEINRQDKAGVSALMILATRGNPKEIADAVHAGANASLRDVRGRTALDYLRAANCGKDPLKNEMDEWMSARSRKCDALDEGDFRESRRILKAAMRQPRRAYDGRNPRNCP